MANLASSKKRIKQNERNRIRNRARKSIVKTETRKFLDAVHSGNFQLAEELLGSATKAIDQVTAKGTFHRNTAARKKSRLARTLNTARGAAKTG